jgi:micrococcal nuclease
VAKIYPFKHPRSNTDPRSNRRPNWRRSGQRRWNGKRQSKSMLSHFKSTILLFFIAAGVFDSIENAGIEPAWMIGRTPEKVEMRFARCEDGVWDNCVIDGDTFIFHGRKVRVLGIDTPEMFPSRCPAEANWGERATARLQQILNEGSFDLVSSTRGIDLYGRDLRWLLRDGRAITTPMIDEGLARRYVGGFRSSWCD